MECKAAVAVTVLVTAFETCARIAEQYRSRNEYG
jgi:hypothetical protein